MGSEKFGEHRQEDPSERLDRIENVLPICVRISEYRDGIKRIDVLSENFSQLVSKNQRILDFSEDLRKFVLEKNASSVDQLYGQKQEQDRIKIELKELKYNISCLASSIESIASDVKSIKNDLYTVQDRYKKESVLDKVKFVMDVVSDQKSQMDTILRSFASLAMSHEGLVKSTEDIKQKVSCHSETSEDHMDRMDKISNDLSSHKIIQQEQAGQFHSRIEDLKKSIFSVVDQKISEIKFPDIVPHIEDMKKLIANSVESVLMDAKIAVSRTNNNEMKLGLLDKKLDQLSLTVKRFELTQ